MDPNERTRLPFAWPDPPMRIVLVEPEIAPNTGNIARLCAATRSELHLVEPLGFRLTDAAVRRAGLDYWQNVHLVRHRCLEDFLEAAQPLSHVHFLSTRGGQNYSDATYAPGDWLVFGSESCGLPEALLKAHPERARAVPMDLELVRSLNLANTVAIVLYEALRQLQP